MTDVSHGRAAHELQAELEAGLSRRFGAIAGSTTGFGANPAGSTKESILSSSGPDCSDPKFRAEFPIRCRDSTWPAQNRATANALAPTIPTVTERSPGLAKIQASLVQFDGPITKSGITLEAEFLEDGPDNGNGKVVYPGNSRVLIGSYKTIEPGQLAEFKVLDEASIKKLDRGRTYKWTLATFSDSNLVLECVYGTTASLNQKKGICRDNLGNRYNLVF